jgi:ketosteroid isomerase-like protein
MRIVKGLWRVYEEGGHDAGVEAMLASCHEDAEFRFYAAEGRVLHGGDELRAFYEEKRAAGASVAASPHDFREEGDVVEVTGWVRVERESGSLADAQVRWIYTFRDGRIEAVDYGPLVPAQPSERSAAGTPAPGAA